MGNLLPGGPRLRVIASPETWIEGEALRQLEDVAGWPGMVRCVGLPDLHPGKGGPVGAAFLAQGVIYPTLVGSDIGCGMALWATDLAVRKLRPERAADRLDGLDRPWDGDPGPWLAEAGLAPTPYDHALGTVGHGNHFAELLAVETVREAVPGLDPERAVLLVHTGSRGLGEAILRATTERHGAVGLASESPAAVEYRTAHDRALRWAAVNRALVAHRMLTALGADGRCLFACCHNAVGETGPDGATGCGCWLHRKGAAPADGGPVVIPGSRGTYSYLVRPLPGADASLWSLAHGAGRKLARGEARAKLKPRFRRADLERTPFGGRVVCGDEALLYEEAPAAYKDVDQVVGDLVAAGLATVLAVLRPLVTFKTSAGASDGTGSGRAGDWRHDRRAARAAKERRR